MTLYFLDTEFNGFGGELLSLALIREDGESLYLISTDPVVLGPWVADNVWPFMDDCPIEPIRSPLLEWPNLIAEFLMDCPDYPRVIADWPDDLRHLCAAIITGPGTMAPISRLAMEVVRVNSYPTDLPGAVQHNAWWDAMALRHRLTGKGRA